jgi:hypothetical protein
MTKSEQLFESFCTSNKIPFVRLIPDGQKTPDYEIELGGVKIITEIKELTVNEEEKQVLKDLDEKHSATWGKGKIGDRIRNKIEAGKRQLERVASSKYPGVLVLYDTRPMPFTGIHPYEIEVAMYGWETIDVHVSENYEDPVKFGAHRFGKGKKLRPDSHTYISALAVLREKHPENELHLDIYHNVFADIPLPIESFVPHDKITAHTILPNEKNEFHGWSRIVAD